MNPAKYHITLERGVWHLQPGRVRHSFYSSRSFAAVCEAARLSPVVPPLPPAMKERRA